MNHDHHGGKMMWVMMLACAVPVLVSVVTRGRTGATFWVLLGIGTMFGLHWLAMRHPKKHDDHNDHHGDDHTMK